MNKFKKNSKKDRKLDLKESILKNRNGNFLDNRGKTNHRRE